MVKFLQRNRSLLLIFLSGLLLRLIIMPWAMHSDLLSMYYRAYLMVGRGLWRLPTNQFLAHLVYADNLLLMRLLGWDLHAIFPAEFGLELGFMTSSVGDWLNFVNHPQINSILFWLKLPHLLVDTAVLFSLNNLFSKNRRKNLILTSWWFNPVNIYAFYIFSRHDVFTAAALLAMIIFTARNKLVPTLISLFAGIQIRVQPLLLSPLVVVQLWYQRKSFKEFTRLLLISLVPIGLYLLAIRVLPFNAAEFTAIVGEISVGAPPIVGVPRHVSQTYGTTVLGFPVFYTIYVVLGVIWLVKAKLLKKSSDLFRLTSLIRVTTAVMAVYFAVNPFSPHYFAWFSIFFTLSILVSKRVIGWYGLALLGWTLMGTFSEDVTWFNQNLFLPVSPSLFRTPSPAVLLQTRLANTPLSLSTIYSLSRTIFSLGLMGIVFEMIERYLRRYLKPVFGSLLVVVLMHSFSMNVSAAAVSVYEQPDADQSHLLSEQKLSQRFISPVEEFGIIEIRIGTQRVPGSTPITFRIREVLDAPEGDWLYEAVYDRDDFYNGYFYPFGFPQITNSSGREFEFELIQEEDQDLPTVVYQNKVGEYSFVVVADKPIDEYLVVLREDLTSKAESQAAFFIFYCLTIGPTFALMIFLALQNQTEKITKHDK